MQTLKGRDLYSQIRVLNAEPLQDKNGKDYFRVAKGKTVFTVDTNVADDLRNGAMAEINLEEGIREVEIDGKKETVTALSYAGHLTFAQVTNIVRSEGTIKQLEASFSVPVGAMPTAEQLA